MYQSVPNKTPEELREEFSQNGLCIAEWARANGFSAALVYQVLAGRKRCRRGQSHEIAVRLGLKQGLIGTVHDIGVPVSRGAVTTPPREETRPQRPTSRRRTP